ncbi:integrase core domain-containing protein [Mangrovicoccus ximenensis]|uniref:integrase core domain-containing protein n=1 Tax=Mangrovicoccus ximenensis TaxID=1911570 RepID=UPI0038B230A8
MISAVSEPARPPTCRSPERGCAGPGRPGSQNRAAAGNRARAANGCASGPSGHWRRTGGHRQGHVRLIGTDRRADFAEPGKPVQNAFAESVDGKVRDGCLDLHWFRSLRHIRGEIGGWRDHCNLERPRSALGNLSPAQYMMETAAASPRLLRSRRRSPPAGGLQVRPARLT